MSKDKLESGLKQFPCPYCGGVGYLATKHLMLNVEHMGLKIEVDGEGWICEGGCGHAFMSDDLTEQLANEIRRAETGGEVYCHLERQTGEFYEHVIQ